MKNAELIETIEQRRSERAMTQAALAQAAGLSRRALNGFFAGETDLGVRRLLRIAEVLDLSLTLAPGKGRPTEADLASLFREE